MIKKSTKGRSGHVHLCHLRCSMEVNIPVTLLKLPKALRCPWWEGEKHALEKCSPRSSLLHLEVSDPSVLYKASPANPPHTIADWAVNPCSHSREVSKPTEPDPARCQTWVVLLHKVHPLNFPSGQRPAGPGPWCAKCRVPFGPRGPKSGPNFTRKFCSAGPWEGVLLHFQKGRALSKPSLQL